MHIWAFEKELFLVPTNTKMPQSLWDWISDCESKTRLGLHPAAKHEPGHCNNACCSRSLKPYCEVRVLRLSLSAGEVLPENAARPPAGLVCPAALGRWSGGTPAHRLCTRPRPADTSLYLHPSEEITTARERRLQSSSASNLSSDVRD